MALLNRCIFLPVSAGLADFVVSAAVLGFRTPSQAGAVNGQTYSYVASSSENTLWEIGRGTYNSAGAGTLARSVVLWSSNANSLVNFNLAPNVAIDALAEDFPSSTLLQLTAGSTAFVDLQTSTPTQGFFASGSGAIFQNLPLVGGLAGLHQVSSVYVKSTAVQNATIAEYMVTFDSNLNSGLAPTWVGSTPYTAGGFLVNGLNVYLCTHSGTSASSGGPTGTGSVITDGSVVWAYQVSNFAAAKVGVFFSAVTGPNSSPNSWGFANDLIIGSGDVGIFKVGAEFDIQNNAGDFFAPGNPAGKNAYNVYVSGNVNFPLTAQLAIAPQTTTGFSAYYGLLINGLKVASVADLEISGGAAFGLSISGLFGSHSIAAIGDASTAPYGINLFGAYSSAAINVPTVSNITVNTLPMLTLSGVASAVNGFTFTNAATAGTPKLVATGADASINLGLGAKGGGVLVFQSATQFASFSALGSVATALSSIGPIGSHTTVQTWLNIVDNTGAVRYIPCF